MKKFMAIMISTAVMLLSFASPVYAAIKDFQPAASDSVVTMRIAGLTVPMPAFLEEYSWLFLPGLIALIVVVLLIINIIKLKKGSR